ncbi:hypothetical protein [Hyphomicrobium sp.]|uniref:hypothetical protein n=1 Tax=Hyphomicrobium sp. TaxID=82 RepID=UPI0025C40592|nr:hypothetical protein [Hyphomicrobium sp.]MCC7252150.1 hypothetical protein [Hyphomicrobium sp.]
MTECQHPDLPLLSAWDLKPIELLILHVLRTLCAGLEHNQLVCWIRAFDTAEERLGAIDGPMVVSGCVSLLRALRAERACGFGSMSTDCAHISEDEQDLMALIRAGRCMQHGDTHLASAVRQVATNSNPSRLNTAARAIGALCIRHDGLQEVASSTPQQPPTQLN